MSLSEICMRVKECFGEGEMTAQKATLTHNVMLYFPEVNSITLIYSPEVLSLPVLSSPNLFQVFNTYTSK